MLLVNRTKIRPIWHFYEIVISIEESSPNPSQGSTSSYWSYLWPRVKSSKSGRGVLWRIQKGDCVLHNRSKNCYILVAFASLKLVLNMNSRPYLLSQVQTFWLGLSGGGAVFRWCWLRLLTDLQLGHDRYVILLILMANIGLLQIYHVGVYVLRNVPLLQLYFKACENAWTCDLKWCNNAVCPAETDPLFNNS